MRLEYVCSTVCLEQLGWIKVGARRVGARRVGARDVRAVRLENGWSMVYRSNKSGVFCWSLEALCSGGLWPKYSWSMMCLISNSIWLDHSVLYHVLEHNMLEQ
jgi:hypothetical protein